MVCLMRDFKDELFTEQADSDLIDDEERWNELDEATKKRWPACY